MTKFHVKEKAKHLFARGAPLFLLLAVIVIGIMAPIAFAVEDTDDGDASFYKMSSTGSAYLSDAMAKSGLGGEVSQSAAGGLLGYCDALDESGVISKWLHSSFSNSSISFSHDSFKTTPSLYAYCKYGQVLNALGLDRTGAEGAHILRAIAGFLLYLAYAIAYFVPFLFAGLCDILWNINPFRFFNYNSSLANIENLDYYATATDGSTVSLVNNGLGLQSVAQLLTTVYDFLYENITLVILTLSLVILITNLVFSSNKNAFKKIKNYIMKLCVMFLVVPLCAMFYTDSLFALKQSMQVGTEYGVNRIVLSTIFDFEAWAKTYQLGIPQTGIADLTMNTSRNRPSDTALINLRNTAFNINVKTWGKLSRGAIGSGVTDLTESVSYYNDTSGEVGGSFVSWNQGIFGELSSYKSYITTQSVYDLLGRYMKGTFYYSSSYETDFKTDSNHAYSAIADTVEKTGTTVAKFKSDGIQLLAPGSTDLVWGRNVSGISGDSLGSHSGVNWDFSSSSGLSPMAMYNYLSSKFDDSNVIVYSNEKSSSGFIRDTHFSANLIGSNMLESFLYWLNAFALLSCISTLGFFYAMALLFTNIKRSFLMFPNIFGTAFGAFRQAARLVGQTLLLLVEVLTTVFVYMLAVEFLMSMNNIIEAPLVASFTANPGGSTGISFGSIVLISLLISVIVKVVFCYIAIKVRKQIVKAIDESVTSFVDRLFGVQHTPMPDTPSLGSRAAGALATGLGAGAASKLLGGGDGGNDNVRGTAVADDAGADGGGEGGSGGGAGGAGGEGGSGGGGEEGEGGPAAGEAAGGGVDEDAAEEAASDVDDMEGPDMDDEAAAEQEADAAVADSLESSDTLDGGTPAAEEGAEDGAEGGAEGGAGGEGGSGNGGSDVVTAAAAGAAVGAAAASADSESDEESEDESGDEAADVSEKPAEAQSGGDETAEGEVAPVAAADGSGTEEKSEDAADSAESGGDGAADKAEESDKDKTDGVRPVAEDADKQGDKNDKQSGDTDKKDGADKSGQNKGSQRKNKKTGKKLSGSADDAAAQAAQDVQDGEDGQADGAIKDAQPNEDVNGVTPDAADSGKNGQTGGGPDAAPQADGSHKGPNGGSPADVAAAAAAGAAAGVVVGGSNNGVTKNAQPSADVSGGGATAASAGVTAPGGANGGTNDGAGGLNGTGGTTEASGSSESGGGGESSAETTEKPVQPADGTSGGGNGGSPDADVTVVAGGDAGAVDGSIEGGAGKTPAPAGGTTGGGTGGTTEAPNGNAPAAPAGGTVPGAPGAGGTMETGGTAGGPGVAGGGDIGVQPTDATDSSAPAPRTPDAAVADGGTPVVNDGAPDSVDPAAPAPAPAAGPAAGQTPGAAPSGGGAGAPAAAPVGGNGGANGTSATGNAQTGGGDGAPDAAPEVREVHRGSAAQGGTPAPGTTGTTAPTGTNISVGAPPASAGAGQTGQGGTNNQVEQQRQPRQSTDNQRTGGAQGGRNRTPGQSSGSQRRTMSPTMKRTILTSAAAAFAQSSNNQLIKNFGAGMNMVTQAELVNQAQQRGRSVQQTPGQTPGEVSSHEPPAQQSPGQTSRRNTGNRAPRQRVGNAAQSMQTARQQAEQQQRQQLQREQQRQQQQQPPAQQAQQDAQIPTDTERGELDAQAANVIRNNRENQPVRRTGQRPVQRRQLSMRLDDAPTGEQPASAPDAVVDEHGQPPVQTDAPVQTEVPAERQDVPQAPNVAQTGVRPPEMPTLDDDDLI